MNGEQKYNEALERARKEYKTHESFNGFRVMLLHIFPELEESDDERIRKKLFKMLNDMERDESILDDYGLDKLKTIAWLEKQESVEEIVERSKTSWFNAGKIQGKMEGLSDEEKYQQGWHDAIENQGEQKPAWSKEDERIYQSIMDDTVQENQLDDKQTEWLSDIKYRYFPQPNQEWGEENEEKIEFLINLIRFQVKDSRYSFGYGDNVTYVTKEEILDWLKSLKDRIQSKPSNKPQGKTALEAIKEEKVDNANKIESKFKVGDWVVRKDGKKFRNDYKFAQITEIDGEKYWFDTGLIYLKAEDMRLWTLEDAKDGDILYSKKHNLLWRYKNTKECYYCINLNYNRNNILIGNEIVIPNDVKPATQEQRDLLFDKMLQHTTSEIYGKKELKEIESKFHEGDWVIGVATEFKPRQIVEVLTSGYKTSNGGWIGLSFECGMHLWTIDDAKDGDVLISWTNKPFIYNGFFNEGVVGAYCGLNTFNRIIIPDKQDYLYYNWTIKKHVRPATKEQRDFLFKKIEDKGYEWDNEKKLLKN